MKQESRKFTTIIFLFFSMLCVLGTEAKAQGLLRLAPKGISKYAMAGHTISSFKSHQDNIRRQTNNIINQHTKIIRASTIATRAAQAQAARNSYRVSLRDTSVLSQKLQIKAFTSASPQQNQSSKRAERTKQSD